MGRLTGWLAIAMAVFGLAPSVVPGAFSVFGLMISLLALIFSLFSISAHGQRYFRITAAIGAAGMLLVNAALRIWEPLPMPLPFKAGLYGLAFFVAAICTVIACRLASGARSTHGA